MAIHVDILAELERRSVQKASDQLDRAFRDMTVGVGVDVKAAEIKAAAAKIQKEFSNLRVEVKGLDNVNKELDRFSRSARVASKEGQNLTGIIQEVGTAAFKTGRGLTTIAAPLAVKFMVDLAQVAVTATQSLYLLPAAASAAAAGIGTLQLATAGFADTIKNVRDPEKFAESIQALAPNAQQAALSIRQLLPEFDKLQQATQDTFFEGFAQQIQRLSTEYLPSIQRLTVSIADSFNKMVAGVSNQLMTPETRNQMEQTFANISTMFQNLTPAAQSLTRAFSDIASTGSTFLPGLATSISNAAAQFASFISEARQSGQLDEWIQEGIDAVKVLGEAIWDLGQLIYQVFGSDGRSNVENFNNTLHATKEIIGFITLDTQSMSDSWKEELDSMYGPLGAFRDGIMDIPEALAAVGNTAIDMANKVKHALDFMATNATNVINFLNPFGDDKAFQPLPDIPRMPAGGDWGGHQMPLPGSDQGPRPGAQRERRGLPPVGGPTGMPGAPWNNLPIPSAPPGSGAGGGADKQPGIGGAFAAGFTDTRQGWNPALQDLMETQKDLSESTRELNSDLGSMRGAIDQLGVALDPDFGLSKGLAGLAENLVAFLGNLAAAPILGPLAAISQAQGGVGRTGSGLIGIAAAQGAFGPQYTPAGLAAADLAAGGGGTGVPTSLGGAASALASGGYAGDAALLANVPAGRYSQTQAADLTQGIADCSSAVEDLVNLMDGMPTGGREMATGNAAEWLTSRGFLPGSMPGAFNVGFNSGHMQATLPGGTPFNWGSNASAARGGVGGSGAFDPSFTDHYYRPVGGGGSGSGTNWDAIAGAEASGNWQTNTGNGFSGGLQFTPSSWAAAGGTQYAPEAWMATPAQQKAAAERLLAMQGPGAWPATSAAHPEWFGGRAPELYSPENTNPALNNPQGFAKGGAIPAFLHKGEHVLTSKDVSALGGQSGVYGFRNALHYDKGGGVPFPEQPPPPTLPSPPGPFGPRAEQAIKTAVPGLGGAAGGLPGGSPPGLGGAAGEIGKQGPSPIGGGEPPNIPGGSAGAGGGLMGAATGAAAMAADVFAPGSGAAVQIASQEIQRAIKFGSQVAGIAAQGLMETFIPFGGSDLASNNWITRIGGAFAGMTPQLPNLAGKSHSADTMEQANAAPVVLPPTISSAQGSGAASGPQITNNINYTNNGAANDPGVRDMTDHLGRQYQNMPGLGR